MIKEVTGDILLTKADAVAHSVAVNDDFKQGLNFSMREQWPSMYKDFRHFCHSSGPKTGEVWAWKGANTPVIFNLFTQEEALGHGAKPGKASLANVNRALHELKKELKSHGVKSLAITKVSTGVGGLSWDDVKPLIAKTLGDAGIPIYVYSNYKKAEAAKELQFFQLVV